MNLYVVRHGETDMGKNKTIATVDEPLNNHGINQTVNLGLELKDIHIDSIYCSPIKRARHTLKLFGLDKAIPVIIDDRLKERDMGIYEGISFENLDWEVFWGINSEKKYKNIESMKDVYKRVSLFLDEIKRFKKENILIVTHGGIEIAINWYFKGFNAPLLECENGKIYEYYMN